MKKTVLILASLFFVPIVALSLHKNLSAGDNSHRVLHERLLLEFKTVPSKKQLVELAELPEVDSINRFDSFDSQFFRRFFEVYLRSEDFKSNFVSHLKKRFPEAVISEPQQADLATLFPSPNTKGLSTDKYINYQWALKNQGYMVEQELTDLLKEKTYSKKGVDIGWSSPRLQSLFQSKIKKDIVIAVLDSGIDHSHSDIRDNIYRNTAECDDGDIPLDPKDRDGNGLAGDCMGWDFTGINKKQAHRPLDKIGHGTHVAGIISAIHGNKEGISGLSNRLKILPVKVTFEGDGPKNRRGTTHAIVDRMAKGILYAIKMKAQVINFSLGWPKAADQKVVREAIKEAQKAGVTIVAAAGNNNHRAPIFPCSYEGVICVGSVDVDGKVSDFSNYGTQVDFLAPGDHILSLIPKSIESDYWNIEGGYDRKSGTSQAAPYVSAMAGLIKGVHPQLGPKQVYARLAASSQASQSLVTWNGKSSLLPLPHLEKAVTQPLGGSLVLPSFKSLYYVELPAKSRSTTIEIPITNYGSKHSGPVRVQVKSLNPGIRTFVANSQLSSLKPGSKSVVRVKLTVKNKNIESLAKLQVTLNPANQSQKTYEKQIEVIQGLKGDSRVLNFPIAGNTKDRRWSLSSLPSHLSEAKYPEYYHKSIKDKTLTLKIYRKSGNSYKELRPLVLPQTINLLSLERLDHNLDGRDDYYLRVVELKGEEKVVQHLFLDNNLNPLYGQRLSKWSLDFETVILNPSNFRWMKIPSQLFGEIRVPIFQAQGLIPEWDKNPDEFEFEPNTELGRIYYLEPYEHQDGTIHLRTRNWDNYLVQNQVRQKLRLSYLDKLRFSHLMPQSLAEFKSGDVHLMIESGQSYPLETYRVFLTAKNGHQTQKGHHGLNFQIAESQNEMAPLGRLKLKPTIRLSNNKFELGAGSLFPSIESHRTAHMFWSQNGDVDQILKFTTNALDNHVHQVIQGYEVGDEKVAYLMTKDSLHVLHAKNHIQNEFRQDLIRSTFLRGHLFQESLYPVAHKSNGKLWPAIYIDSTRLTGSKISIWAFDGQKAISPIRYNVSVPEGCDPLNPAVWQDSHAYMLICQVGKKKVLKVLPLK